MTHYDMVELANDWFEEVREHGKSEEKYRRLLKKLYKRHFPAHKETLVSPWDEYGRMIMLPDEERYYETAIYRYNGTCDPEDTVEDIEKWYWDEYATRITVPWDCSGKWFTSGVHAVKMTDTTFSLIEYMGLDV